MNRLNDVSEREWDRVNKYWRPTQQREVRKNMKIQPIDFINENGFGYCEGNVVKYISRYNEHHNIESLREASHYIEILIQKELCNAK